MFVEWGSQHTLWHSVQWALQSTVTISRKITLNFTIENLFSNGGRVSQTFLAFIGRTWWQLSTWWIGWAMWPSQRWHKAVRMPVTMANMPVRIGQEDSEGPGDIVKICEHDLTASEPNGALPNWPGFRLVNDPMRLFLKTVTLLSKIRSGIRTGNTCWSEWIRCLWFVASRGGSNMQTSPAGPKIPKAGHMRGS